MNRFPAHSVAIRSLSGEDVGKEQRVSTLLPAISAPEGDNLPAVYQERPLAYFCRRLGHITTLNLAQMNYLAAIMASLRVTESRAECEVAEQMLARLKLRLP